MDATQRRVVFAAAVGSALEWYDFFIYGTAAALVFGDLFFPKLDPTVGTLAAFATFGVGFAARPIGGHSASIVRLRHLHTPRLRTSEDLLPPQILRTRARGLLPIVASEVSSTPSAHRVISLPPQLRPCCCNAAPGILLGGGCVIGNL